ncbi:MAG: hypothetical protein FWD68_06955 [Alphaproteobacteria bacterium]|nr:hypothetical protein [Alphaproteobacteria bacterium]
MNLLSALIVPGLIVASPAMAQSLTEPAYKDSHKVSVPKKPKPSNSCASYGPGFVWVASSGSCVKIGGSVELETGMRLSHR